MTSEPTETLGVIVILVALGILLWGSIRWRGAEREARSYLTGQQPSFWKRLDPHFYRAGAHPYIRRGWQAYLIMGAGLAAMGAAALLFGVGPSRPVAVFEIVVGLFMLARGQQKITKTDRAEGGAAVHR